MNNQAIEVPSLKDQIRGLPKGANVLSVLEKAEVNTDVQIQKLTREDLNELLPGVENFKIRSKISELIDKSKQNTCKPIDAILKELRGFVTDDVIENALAVGGVMHDYLSSLKDVEKQLANAQYFIQAQIKLLERSMKSSDDGTLDITDTQSSVPSTPHDPATAGNQLANAEAPISLNRAVGTGRGGEILPAKHNYPDNSSWSVSSLLRGNQPKKQVIWPVKVHSVLCGKTLDTHLRLMERVDTLGLYRKDSSADDCHVMIVFCPITSRRGTDINMAMASVPDSKDVILVVMHHTFDSHFVTGKKFGVRQGNIVEEVDVLFHDSIGLLQCKVNETAVQHIHAALRNYDKSL